VPDLWMDVDTALSEVPVNLLPMLDDTDGKTKEESVAYNAAGLDLVWNFVTTAGAYTQTAVTPTDTGGNYDWVNQGNAHYTIEMPASGGASINNDTEGFGWFTGVATGVLPWRGPVIGFRAAGLNNALIDDAYSATRGLAGGLDLDAQIGTDIDAILVDTGDNLDATISSRAATGDAMALTGAAVDAILDEVVEGSNTFREYLRAFMAALANKAAGGGTATITFRDRADTKNRITATVDANGNRTATVLDLT